MTQELNSMILVSPFQIGYSMILYLFCKLKIPEIYPLGAVLLPMRSVSQEDLMKYILSREGRCMDYQPGGKCGESSV